MKKISFAILAVTLIAVCLFAGCNGAEGGKVTDNMQNLTEAMTEMQNMMTDVSDFFTNAADSSITGNITNNSVPDSTNNVVM